LKSARNLYVVATCVVALSLITYGLAKGLDSGKEEGGRFAGYLQRISVAPVYYIGAVGVILLGWYWLKLAGGITSMANSLKEQIPTKNLEDAEEEVKITNSTSSPNSAMKTHNKVAGFFASIRTTKVDELIEAINGRFNSYANHIIELEKQINDLQIQIQLTQRQKANSEAIIYSIHDAVIVIDEFDRLLMANEAAGRLFNFDFKQSQHKRIGELTDKGEGKSEFVDFLSHSRQSKAQPTRREIEFLYNGELKTFDCIVSCIYDGSEQVCGIVGVLHDITHEKQVQQMKNDFVNHVCHELKTPLASISAYSEMLSDGEAKDGKTRKEFYTIIQNQAIRLNRLIEDVLNISRIESGLIKVDKEPVSLTILTEEQLQMIKSYADEKNICIKDIGQSRIVFDQVYADRDMISQVIVNLMSNAVKYTPSGGSINVKIEVDESANVARLSVTDTGVGIPEDEIEHVFDKFYRVDANKNQAKGTGLGLNLVKQIIEKVHDGRVFVSSKTGEGSTFGFELPLTTRKVVESLPAVSKA
jgi:PAS domain S-box-containing protein